MNSAKTSKDFVQHKEKKSSHEIEEIEKDPLSNYDFLPTLPGHGTCADRDAEWNKLKVQSSKQSTFHESMLSEPNFEMQSEARCSEEITCDSQNEQDIPMSYTDLNVLRKKVEADKIKYSVARLRKNSNVFKFPYVNKNTAIPFCVPPRRNDEELSLGEVEKSIYHPDKVAADKF